MSILPWASLFVFGEMPRGFCWFSVPRDEWELTDRSVDFIFSFLNRNRFENLFVGWRWKVLESKERMQAVVITKKGGPGVLELQEVPCPRPCSGFVLIRVRAFGLNRAETYFRSGKWGEAHPVSGIECVGQVVEDPSGTFSPGQKVFALMGGLGRTLSGSYGAMVNAPIANVVKVSSDLSWEVLAALPESFATAHACLVDRLRIGAGDRLLVRGGSSALGRAAIVWAKILGAEVIASSRREERFASLSNLGADHPILHEESLAPKIRSLCPGGVDAVLDLIGNRTLLDSMKAVRPGGRVCLAGFLGGGEPLSAFDPLSQMAPSVDLSFFASFLFGTEGVPVPARALQDLVGRVERGELDLSPAHVFRWEELPEAHRMMEENRAEGKIVVLQEGESV